MRVNLQYSIELESIFEELRSLHLRKNIHTVEVVRKNIQDLDSSLIDNNASTSRATTVVI